MNRCSDTCLRILYHSAIRLNKRSAVKSDTTTNQKQLSLTPQHITPPTKSKATKIFLGKALR